MAVNSVPLNRVDTTTFNQERVVRDVDKKLANLAPNRTGIYTMIMKMGKVRPTKNYKFEWFEDEIFPYQTFATASALATDTTISVDKDIFIPHDIIINGNTNEIMLVTAIDKVAHTITVVRGYQGSTAADITANDTLFEIGNAVPEGGKIDYGIKDTISVLKYNYTQEFTTEARISMRAMELAMQAGDTKLWPDKVKKAALMHKEKIERALLFGKRFVDTTNFAEGRSTQTGGLFYFVNSNIMDISGSGGNLTREAFDDFINNLALYYKNEYTNKKILVVGGLISKALNSWLESKVMITNPEYKKLGVEVIEYKTIKGSILIHHSSFFDEIGYNGVALSLDLGNMLVRTFKPTSYNDNVQMPNERMRKSYYHSDLGLQIRSEKVFSILKGVSSYT